MCLASGSADGAIKFWNPKNGEELTTFTRGHTESVKSIAFSENDTTLASAADNGIVDVWSLKTLHKLVTLTKGQCDSTEAVMISADATLFARIGRKGLIAFNPAGFGLRGGFHGRTPLQLWKIAIGDEIHGPWQSVGNNASIILFSPIHNIIAVSIQGEIQAWHVSTSVELFRINARWSPWTDPVFSPDGKWIATSEGSGTTKVWNVEALNIKPAIISIKETDAMTFSPDSSILAIAGEGGIHLWKYGIESEEKPTIIPGNLQSFNSILTFSPDGSMLIGSAMDGWSNPIKLWDVETSRNLGVLSGHTEPVKMLVFSHDSNTKLTGFVLFFHFANPLKTDMCLHLLSVFGEPLTPIDKHLFKRRKCLEYTIGNRLS